MVPKGGIAMNLVADLHTHTVASGHAYSTILENARVAADRGLQLIAMTDHGPSMPGGPHGYHFGNLKAIPDFVFGVRILKGIEANVMDREGKLDLDEERLAKLDIVLAGLHTYCAPYGSVTENTRMMINAMQNKWVDAIVHPGNPEYPVDEAAVVKAAGELDVAVEVNNSSLTVSRQGSRSHCEHIARLAKEYGTKILLGTDSHVAFSVGDFSSAVELLEQHGILAEQVLNTSVDKIYRHLARHRLRCYS
jgi:putative hydrolase